MKLKSGPGFVDRLHKNNVSPMYISVFVTLFASLNLLPHKTQHTFYKYNTYCSLTIAKSILHWKILFYLASGLTIHKHRLTFDGICDQTCLKDHVYISATCF